LGRIAEKGTHDNLIAKEGRYFLTYFTYQAEDLISIQIIFEISHLDFLDLRL